MKEKLNFHETVFNQHIGNANEKVMKFLKEYFPKVYIIMKEYNKKGIMSIFESPSDENTMLYVGLITYIVNEERNK